MSIIDTPTGVMRTYIHRPNSDGPNFQLYYFTQKSFNKQGPIERAAKIMASHGYAVLVPEVFHELKSYRHHTWHTMMQDEKKAMRTRQQKMIRGLRYGQSKRWWNG